MLFTLNVHLKKRRETLIKRENKNVYIKIEIIIKVLMNYKQ